jgi:hypothetical protein
VPEDPSCIFAFSSKRGYFNFDLFDIKMAQPFFFFSGSGENSAARAAHRERAKKGRVSRVGKRASKSQSMV